MKKFLVYIFLLIFTYSFLPKNGFTQSDGSPETNTDTLKKEIIVSLGVGISTYHKEGFLYSADAVFLFSEKFYIGLAWDNYDIIKSFRPPYKVSSLSLNALYKEDFGSDKFNFFVGGGVLISMLSSGGPGGLNGYARIDYNISKKFGFGAAYKQPLFPGVDFAAPPLMLFNILFNYKINN